ncbi:MAG: Abi family protein [Lachnospiraceae bacterium]|nr:Abi family protein [Lachnospiraceae bacterium]
MGKSQKFTNVNEQIQLLTDRGLKFQNLKTAKNYLIYYGYFNVINGYKDLYINKKTDESGNEIEQYKDSVFFEEIVSLYNFDRTLRKEMMGIIIDIEIHLKSVLSYVLGENFTSDQNSYLSISQYKNNYASKKTDSLQNTIQSILDTINSSNKNPIKYHRDKYNNVPPWVAFKEVYLSTTINLIKFLIEKQKNELVAMFYGIDINTFNSLKQEDQKAIKEFFMISIKMIKEYRNACAHGDRIYNYKPKNLFYYNGFKILSKTINISHNYQKPITGLEYLVIAFSCLNLSYDNYIINNIQMTINQHQIAYPNFIENIKNTIGKQLF